MQFYYFVTIILIIWIIRRLYLRPYLRLAYKVKSNKWQTFFGWGKILSRQESILYFYEFGKKYGPNCIYWLGPQPLFITTEPQILREILTAKNCLTRPNFIYGSIKAILDNGLVTANNPFWYRHRKVMIRAFSNKNLISYLTIFQKEIDNIVEKIDSSLEKNQNIDMLVLLRELIFRNSTKTILKRDLNTSCYNIASMLRQLHDIFSYVSEACVNPLLKFSWLRKIAEATIFKDVKIALNSYNNMINETIDILKRNDTTDPYYLKDVKSSLEYAIDGVKQQMIRSNEIKGEILQLFGAAIDTSSTTMFFVLILLAMHPEYQELAYEEITSVLTNDEEHEITSNDLDKLVYLEMIINETLRVIPTIPLVFRQVSDNDLVLSNGLILPVGQIICIDIYSIHRNKELWGPAADVFNPDNFLPTNVANRHPFSFIPFTKGQRFCIGWRYATLFLKISLVKLIRTYKFTTDFKYKDLSFSNHISIMLKEEPKLRLEKRNKLQKS